MCQMKKYHIYFSDGELTRMKSISTTSISSATNVTTNIDIVPVTDCIRRLNIKRFIKRMMNAYRMQELRLLRIQISLMLLMAI